MNGGKAVRIAWNAAAWWIIAGAAMQLAADAILMATSGHVTKFSIPETLLLPFKAATRLLDPVTAYGPYADQLRLPVYGLIAILLIGFVWTALARHGYGNPVDMMRGDNEVPLARHLKPRIQDLGTWTPHDAARNHPSASLTDRIQVMLLRRLFPSKDLARAMTNRTNGMLVPYRGNQPSARVFLGTYRYMHLIRRRKYNVYARPEQHVVIFGPSGAGKGATQMNPTLLFWNGDENDAPDGHGAGWPGTIITSTVKNDHVDAALEWRLSLSDQCFVYDPLQSYPEFRDYWVGWDPLCTVTTFSDANSVATALMESESQQSGGGGGGNEDYFRAQALMVLAPLILSAAMAKAPFKTVYDWALRLEAEVTDPNVINAEGDVDPNSRMYAVLDKLYEYSETAGDETPLNQMQQLFGKDPREASGVWGTIRKSLQPYNDEKSVQSTDRAVMPQMLDPKKFYSTPYSTLFIIAPEVANESKRMRPVFAAFITWLIEEAQKLAREGNGKLPQPALANLDEVKNVGAIPGLAHTLSLTRSIGFFVKHAWQDEAQIASAYGKDDAKTITSNSRTWVVLPGISDPEHLDALAKLIGERPVRKRRAKMNPSDPDQSQRVRAATASMVKEVKDNELLIITDNLPPFVIEATRYFQDPVMLARYEMGNARRKEGIMPVPDELRAWASHATAGDPAGKSMPDVAVRDLVTEPPLEEQVALPVLGMRRPEPLYGETRPYEGAPAWESPSGTEGRQGQLDRLGYPPGQSDQRDVTDVTDVTGASAGLAEPIVSRQEAWRDGARPGAWAATQPVSPGMMAERPDVKPFPDSFPPQARPVLIVPSVPAAAHGSPDAAGSITSPAVPSAELAVAGTGQAVADTELESDRCPNCGREFQLDGMSDEQRDQVLSRHSATHRARAITPGG